MFPINGYKRKHYIAKGTLGSLKGLKEKGCNGPVTEFLDELEDHILEQAHIKEENIMNEALITTVAQIVSAVCITLIGVAGAWLTAKIGKQQQLASVKATTEQVVEAAQLTVGELQQTIVEKLKAGGGKLTEAQAAELGELLKAKTLQKLSAPVIDLLTAAAVDVQALITGAGEDWIGRIKAAA